MRFWINWLGMAGLVLGSPLVRGRDIPADDPALCYRGSPRMDVTAERARVDRLIDAAGGFRYDASGTRICFRTDATAAVARLQANQLHTRRDAVNGTGVIVVDGVRQGTYRVDDASTGIVSVNVLTAAQPVERTVELWLPYGESVDFLGLTVNDDATMLSMEPPVRPRYVAYGDSITHGFRGSDPTTGYAARVATTNGWELINLGFGGRQATAADGATVGAVPADIITVLIGFNDHLHGKPLDQYRADMTGLLARLRAAQPRTPICLLTLLWSTEPYPSRLGLRLEDYRQVLRDIATTTNDPHLHLVEGPELIPADRQYFTDGVHPNDAGFERMADQLAPRLKALVRP